MLNTFTTLNTINVNENKPYFEEGSLFYVKKDRFQACPPPTTSDSPMGDGC